MQELGDRISEALAREESRAERFANNVRLILLVVLTIVALLNALSLSAGANLLNFGALVIGYVYGFIVFLRTRRAGYHPTMKYITSCLDIVLVFLLLFLYTGIEIPSVALKNYVFLVVFPLIALTAFRYDRALTLTAGGLTITLYLALIAYLSVSGYLTITHGGYERELFSSEVTYIGQGTKIFILGGYIILLSSLAHYSRELFARLLTDELSVRVQKELTDWELNIASQVQNRFLPHSLPVVAGLEIHGALQQGKFVGGDYYDFIKLPDDTLLTVIADVSGKGVPASLIMAEVRATIQLLASTHVHLEDLTQRLNTLLHQSTDKKYFVTFFAAVIDAAKQRITYINAGHPPPLICSQRGVRPLEKGTLALGLLASLPDPRVRSEEFLPGEILAAYTDGITEQTNTRGDQYGEERLREYLRDRATHDVRQSTRQLFDIVSQFAQGKEIDDDMTLVLVRYSSTLTDR